MSLNRAKEVAKEVKDKTVELGHKAKEKVGPFFKGLAASASSLKNRGSKVKDYEEVQEVRSSFGSKS